MGGNPYKKRERGGFHGGRGGPGGRGGRDAGGGRGGATGGQKQDTTEGVLETLLKLVFEKQQLALYDPASGMLNLSNLSKCEDLSKIQKSVDFNSPAFCRTLVSVIQQKIGNPRFLNLNGNNIKGLGPLLRSLTELKVHESIGGISLANNKIDSLDFVFALSKFTNLQELVLVGNSVRSNDKLVATLRKKLPSLLGLDGESIVRQPLSLPWPKRSSYDDNQRFILEMIESNLLQQLANKQFESAMTLYSEKATFSYATTKADLMNARVKGEHKDVQSDMAKLKGDIGNQSRSIIDLQRVRQIATDRLQIAANFKRHLFREQFNVMHQLNPNASVVFFDVPLMKVPTCVVTVHGRVMWQHHKLPQEERVLCFDRTMAMTFQGNWSISADTITLRPNNDDPLFFADNASHLEMLERTLSIPKEVAGAVVKQCSSDLEFMKLLQGVGSPQLLMDCCRIANNNFDHAVLTARVATSRQMDPQTAYNTLSANNFSPPQ